MLLLWLLVMFWVLFKVFLLILFFKIDLLIDPTTCKTKTLPNWKKEIIFHHASTLATCLHAFDLFFSENL